VQRRQRIKSTRIKLKIYVNENLMAETEKVNISWPSFDVEFYEKFQIFLYTRPYNVRIDVCECGFTTKVISSVEVEVPGQHVYTLTST
jgi:hypothetical protein